MKSKKPRPDDPWADVWTCVERSAPARRPSAADENDREFEMALDAGSVWRPGKVLHVKFLDGESALHERVRLLVKRWEEHANIHFDFDDYDDAEIRVSFNGNGSWSFVGTDALGVAPAEPTMNLGLQPDTPESYCARAVLHEFGHALGCIHEHQHPEAGIPWNKEQVYRFYKCNYGWSESQVDDFIFRRHARSSTNFSQYDPKSIMQYPVPAELTDGHFTVSLNTELSKMDIDYIRKVYPGRPRRRASADPKPSRSGNRARQLPRES